MAESVVVSNEGLNEASQSLLSCASELSDLFDGIAQVTDSLGANVTGFASIEDFVSKLKKINSTKDSLISKIKEFANYLPTVVASGYDAFAEAIASIDVDLSSLATLIAMLSGTTLGGNTLDSEGVVENSGTQDGDTKGESDGSTTEGNTGGVKQESSDGTVKKSYSGSSNSAITYINGNDNGRTLHWGGSVNVNGERVPLYVDENDNAYFLDESGKEVYLSSFTKVIS